MDTIKSILTNNDCYKTNKKIKVKGIMLHSVGINQPDARVFVNSWNKSGVSKCVHGFIDNLSIYQTLPWDHRGWHCGGSGNNTHIGIEMTEPSHIRYTGGSNYEDSDPSYTRYHVNSCYEKAVELFAYLCKEYNLDPLKDGVILSHKEGYQRGIASNHGDPEHIWKHHGLSMNIFREDVSKKIKYDNVPYRVRVTADALNIRDSYSASSKIKGVIKDKGVYTIVEVRNGWGRLKSGLGWIKLSYTTKL